MSGGSPGSVLAHPLPHVSLLKDPALFISRCSYKSSAGKRLLGFVSESDLAAFQAEDDGVGEGVQLKLTAVEFLDE